MHHDSIDKSLLMDNKSIHGFFGLANTPVVFQRIINEMLGGLHYDQWLPNINELLISSELASALYIVASKLVLGSNFRDNRQVIYR